MEPECSNCRFFQTDAQNVAQGVCRAHPPTMVTMQTAAGPQVVFMFPAVGRQMWCGEYAQRSISGAVQEHHGDQ